MSVRKTESLIHPRFLFISDYNSARFYTELKDASLPRFATAVSWAFGFSSAVYVAIACLGYLTFGGNSSSYILNNYSPYDPLATFCRLAVGISTLTTYPIVFIGCRDGMLDVLNVEAARQTAHNLVRGKKKRLVKVNLLAGSVADFFVLLELLM